MAILTGNSPLQGLRGMIGDQLVFRKNGDKTVVSVKPLTRKRKRNSELQQLYLDKFKDAAKYARSIMRDPEKCDEYRKLAKKQNKHSAWNVAISEYMLSIRIEARDAETTAPERRKRVRFTAAKRNFKVKEVEVKLISRSKEVLAEGQADRINTTDWVYHLPVLPEKGMYLEITARDTLGLATIKDIYL